MSSNYNLFQMWKDYYDQYSNYYDEKITENFPAQGISQVLEMNLFLKKIINETTGQYLEQVNMPSRNDLANVSSLIINVDSKVDELEELVGDIKNAQSSSPDVQKEITSMKKDISDLKKNVSGVDTKLNSILTLLQSLDEKAAQENSKPIAPASAAKERKGTTRRTTAKAKPKEPVKETVKEPVVKETVKEPVKEAENITTEPTEVTQQPN